MEYNVQLETFQGPLDLLLYLVKRHEVDICDIPIARIAEQF
jgi:segregation and condensation protein A